MYSFFHTVFEDKTGGKIFTLFSGWHFFYVTLVILSLTVMLLVLRGKGEETRLRLERALIGIVASLYAADFFLMPLAYGEIDIDKLPFHACTAMCAVCCLSYHVPALKKYRTSFAALGFFSNVSYLVYPAGVMWYEVHPLSYRVIQTMLFHSIMTVYCVIVMSNNKEKMGFENSRRDVGITLAMTVWALVGNYVYSGSADGYSREFNWFFVVRDPFYAIPEAVSPYVAPILNTAVFIAGEFIIRWVFYLINKKKAEKCPA